MYELFANILRGISSLIANQWAWAVILFTLFIRVIILPFDYKSRVSMRKTTKLQPEIQKLQKKYANDKEKLNLKMSELYKKEKVNPLSSCLPMLLTMPILFCMWGGMRIVANEQTLNQVSTMLKNPDGIVDEATGEVSFEVPAERWFWIKNIMMPDSPFASQLPDANTFAQIDNNVFTGWLAGLEEKPVKVTYPATGVEKEYKYVFSTTSVVVTSATEDAEPDTAAEQATDTELAAAGTAVTEQAAEAAQPTETRQTITKYYVLKCERDQDGKAINIDANNPLTLITVDADTNMVIGEEATVNKAAAVRAILGCIGLELDDNNNVISRTKYYTGSGVATSFNMLFWNVNIMKDWNGLFLLPILSALSQLLMTKLNPTAPKKKDAQGNVIKDPSQPNTGAFMTWFFPLFSLWICAQYNGLFALYWVASNIVAMVETFCINKYLDAKEAKAGAIDNAGTVK